MRVVALVVLAACASPFTAAREQARGEVGARVVVVDVASGETVIDERASAGVLPLSLVKLYVAAIWWRHGLPPETHPIEEILMHSDDRGGAALAVDLRRRLGGEAVLAELRADGLAVTLPADADDERWASALSIGEHDATVTLADVARFLATLRDPRVLAALRATVSRGTARDAAARLAGTGWVLGGKTGTGPADATPHDGWFAAIAFAGETPRYALAIYVAGRGPGGGVAAALAADLVKRLPR